MIEFNIDRIRELKGAPLAVFNLLLFCAEPVSQSWLERWSGYSDKPISQACNFLKEKGLVQATLDGWFLANDLNLPQPVRNISDPIIISINDLDPEVLELQSTNNTETRKNSDPQIEQNNPRARFLAPESPEKTEMWQILSQAGIHRNDRTRDLLKLPHITPDYLRLKLEDYQSQGKNNPAWMGLVIRALEDGEPPAARAPNGHLLTCQCSKCAVRNFKRRR